MKKIILLAAVLICAASYSFAQQSSTGVWDQTNCKGSGLDYFNRSESPIVNDFTIGTDYDSQKGPGYRIEYNDGILTVSWFDIVTTCALPVISIDLKNNGETLNITFNIDRDAPSADCICLYDFKASFEDIAPGHYTIVADFGINYEVDLENTTDIILYRDEMTNGIEFSSTDKSGLALIGKSLIRNMSAEPGILEIYDSNGLRLVELSIGPDAEIDITPLASGLYTAILKTDKSPQTLRFIK